ncbi:hypothetical protein L4D12_22055 [Photobacterium nomapromontoriensis]
MSTSLTPPTSDFVGSLPQGYKTEFNHLNEEPSEPLPGGVLRSFQFDNDSSLLTVIYRLPHNRLYWNTNKFDIEKAVISSTCSNFAGDLKAGLGIRYWYAGNGGFITDVISQTTCKNI